MDVAAMSHFLDGGAAITELNNRAMELLAEMKEAPPTSLAEARALTRAHVNTFYNLFLEHGMDMPMRKAMVRAFSLYDMGWYIRNGVHFGLFLSAITSQGSKDQQNEWLPQVLMKEIYGCFAMTELGHGSAVAALETTATFDHATREFIIDTPKITATKWMIGAVGESATHAAVYAQLILDGVKKGLHVFLVPLRSREPPHTPLPGIALGDCGVKMGLNGVDNGWIQFKQVRVPYDNFLNRFARITDDGKYETEVATTSKPSTALIATRGELVMLSISMLKKALTISVRYGAVRTQGNVGPDGKETTLLDYPSHQVRLLPLVAKAYAYHFQATYIEALIESIDQGSDDDVALAEVHGTMSGLKAFCTWDTLAALETCRQCCGGNGYMGMNGLGAMVADFSVMVTFEGDNTVMAQQTGAFVCRAYEAHVRGKPSLKYLRTGLTGANTWAPVTADAMVAIPALRHLLDFYAATKVARVHDAWTAEVVTNAAASFPCQVEWIEVARVHVFHSVATRFLDNIAHLATTGSSLTPVLSRLAELFVLSEVEKNGVFFLAEGFMTSAQFATVQATIATLCRALRPDAVLLVDAFNLHDVILQSCIGRYDGDVYTSILSHL
ncbi:acyl-CoA dehydrogenase/oxidase [Achlya hypogyna]|uniref:Acyl-coenzyme A oxidase n=1 Tax=Achlya hypogyna TaxID=1202772 RepID=A0A1V9Y6B5_ACHHY|nr:acyl-CoA dehydrogenase/oxidase [Achlya hypogyna]